MKSHSFVAGIFSVFIVKVLPKLRVVWLLTFWNVQGLEKFQ
jgi:hypothetical protein